MASSRKVMSIRSAHRLANNVQNSFICSTCRRSVVRQSSLLQLSSAHLRYASSTTIPRLAQPSFWYSMVPKFLRHSDTPTPPQKSKNKEWNPATFFILIFLLIGSQSIRQIGLRNEIRQFSQKSDAKLSVLREVIEKLQKGEDVDVEKLLGTGDAVKEREWEEVLREIEEDESLWHSQKSRPKRKSDMEGASDKSDVATDSVMEEPKGKSRSPGTGSFY